MTFFMSGWVSASGDFAWAFQQPSVCWVTVIFENQKRIGLVQELGLVFGVE